MKINEFHHIGLKTADLDRSAAFYGALGAEETTRFKLPSGRSIAMLAFSPEYVIEVIEGKEGEAAPAAGWVHIALKTENCDEAFEAAVQAGAAVQTAPEDKMLGSTLARIAFVTGPDGETVEFFQEK